MRVRTNGGRLICPFRCLKLTDITKYNKKEIGNMITKDMTIMEVLQTNRNTAGVFASYNMGCIGCLAAHGETVEQAAVHHGIDVDEMIEKLNEVCKG